MAGTETLDINSLELHAKGGEGTDFKPGFEYIEKEQLMPSCAIYFTDGWCMSFPEPPEYPVLWILTTDTKFSPPFGEVIKMN